MRAHVVGSGMAGLAAAAYLVGEGGVLPANVSIYDAAAELGGAMAFAGSATDGYILPTGRVFEAQYRCAFDLFSRVPAIHDPSVSVRDDILAFNDRFGIIDRMRLLDRDLKVRDSPHFGLSLRDRLDLLKLAVTPESLLDAKQIEAFFTSAFFETDFWLLWVTLMNSLPQHSTIEMRRFMHRFLHVLPNLSNMTSILRSRYNQRDAIILPIASWLKQQGVMFHPATRVLDVGFVPARDRITANEIKVIASGQTQVIEVSPEDIVLVTNGSQVDGLTIGSMTSPPPPPPGTETCPLWRRLALGRVAFGTPDTFFGPAHIADTAWVTFTVTEAQPIFTNLMSALTGSEPGRAGLVTLTGSNWLLTLAIFHKPEFLDQPDDAWVWWGYGLYPARAGNFVSKPMQECSGAEILGEVLHHLKFEREADDILKHSTCIPCLLPYAGSIWLPRSRTSRPQVVPQGSINFGFIGQFAELPLEAAFTMEYAVRTAWHAVATLRPQSRKPPPVYQGSHDAAALRDALAMLA